MKKPPKPGTPAADVPPRFRLRGVLIWQENDALASMPFELVSWAVHGIPLLLIRFFAASNFWLILLDAC